METTLDYTIEKRLRARSAISRNAYNLSVPVKDYLTVLSFMGVALVGEDLDPWNDDSHNEACAYWWEQCNALSTPERIELQYAVRTVAGALPPGPVEEVA
jgi:hypothetical protein